MISRRSLLGFIAASPVIIKASSLMSVRSFVAPARGLLVIPWQRLDEARLLGFATLKIEGTPVAYDDMSAYQNRLARQFARDKLLAAARAMNGESS